MLTIDSKSLSDYLQGYRLDESLRLFGSEANRTQVESIVSGDKKITKYINEFWTSKQRQSSSIHEISYRACFKAQLPRFFINLLTEKNDTVYDPFSGRGTTIIEAGLLGRRVVSNDINPLSKIFTEPRLSIPEVSDIEKSLHRIKFNKKAGAEIDLSMFYHSDTLAEIVSLKGYLLERTKEGLEDNVDKWIRMIATNRLTGHSRGFFSVYTLPPNQAVSPESQIKINEKRNQKPDYRNVKAIILNKTESLLKNVKNIESENLNGAGKTATFLINDARKTSKIKAESVDLTVTSPPFLDIVQYSKDNWLRCWFNSIDDKKIEKKITMSKTIQEWSSVMHDVFMELYRITKRGGWVAFEVGEVRRGSINLDEHVVPLGINAGFTCEGIAINLQEFTKTSNIWGISNKEIGTNTNRIVLFNKN